MALYRTFSVMRHTNILKFVQPGDLAAVKNFIPKEDIFYQYLSGKAVTSDCETRFGYVGCPVRPLYLSESKETTYYEFAYWLLKKPSEIKNGVRIATVEVDIEAFNLGIHVNDLNIPLRTEVLDHTTYYHAHEWVKSLDPLPENIVYPSVRNPQAGGTNFAIFKGTLSEHKFLNFDEYFTLEADNISLKLSSGSVIKPNF